MKYTIYGFNQKACCEQGIDMTDLLVLSFINTCYPIMTKEIHDGKEYAWFNYNRFLEEYPILGITKTGSVSHRLLKLERKGIILKHCIRNKNGSFSYVHLTQKYFNLLSQPTEHFIQEGLDGDTRGGLYDDTSHTNPVTTLNPITTNPPKKKTAKRKVFIAPTKEDVIEYAETRDRPDLAIKFFDYYTALDWKDNRDNKVKNWKAKFITWEGRNEKPAYYAPKPDMMAVPKSNDTPLEELRAEWIAKGNSEESADEYIAVTIKNRKARDESAKQPRKDWGY